MKKAFGLFVMCITIAGFTIFQSCNSTKPITSTPEQKSADISSKLRGMWILKTIDQTDVSDAFKGKVPTLSFDFDKKLMSGNAGCNNYTGGFSLEGNKLKPSALATTMMVCTEANQENKFTSLMDKESTLIFNNYSLQFVQDGKVVLVFTPRAR